MESVAAFEPRARTAIVLGSLWAIAMAFFAAAPHYSFALAALFVAGVLQIGFTSMATTIVQLEAPPAERGRTIGVFSMSLNGLRMGSGFSVGFLGAAIGIDWSLGLSAVALFLLTIGLFMLVRRAAPARAPAAMPMEMTTDHHAGCC